MEVISRLGGGENVKNVEVLNQVEVKDEGDR